jgi:hypothetical protein
MSDQHLWLIWSYENNAWWGPNKCGYTKEWQQAGRYRYGEAVQICDNANRYSKLTNEEMVHTTNVENFMAKKKMPEKMRDKAQQMKEKAAPKKAEKK